MGYDIDIGDIILNQRLTSFSGEHLEQLGSLSCLANRIEIASKSMNTDSLYKKHQTQYKVRSRNWKLNFSSLVSEILNFKGVSLWRFD